MTSAGQGSGQIPALSTVRRLRGLFSRLAQILDHTQSLAVLALYGCGKWRVRGWLVGRWPAVPGGLAGEHNPSV